MPQYGLGRDVAGHVDATGSGTFRFRLGDAVIGLRDLLFAGGAHAEYVVLDESAVAAAPPSVPLTDAATLPLNGSTAARALDLAGLAPGQTLLVTGASGGVGGFALRLAAIRGLRTVAPARPHDAHRVRTLGASEVVTSSDDLGAAVRRIVPGSVDAVVDAAILGITAHQALRGAGTFVVLVAPFASPPSVTRVSSCRSSSPTGTGSPSCRNVSTTVRSPSASRERFLSTRPGRRTNSWKWGASAGASS